MKNLAHYFPVTTFREISRHPDFRSELVRANVSHVDDLSAGSVIRCNVKPRGREGYIGLYVQVTHDLSARYLQTILERSPVIDHAYFVSFADAPAPDDTVFQVTNVHNQYLDVSTRLQHHDACFTPLVTTLDPPSLDTLSTSCFIVGSNSTTRTAYCAVLPEGSPWGQRDITPASRDAIVYQVAQHYGEGCQIAIVARRSRCDLSESMSLLPIETLPPSSQPSIHRPAVGMTWEPLTQYGGVFGARSAHGIPLRATKDPRKRTLHLDAWTDRGWQEAGFAECPVDKAIDSAVINSLLAGYLRLF